MFQGFRIYPHQIETCLGCRLLNLPEVDGFIKDDFTKKYSNTILKTAPGQSPVLHLLDKNKKAIRSIDIVSLTRIELNNILLNSGIPLKDFGKSRRKAHDL